MMTRGFAISAAVALISIVSMSPAAKEDDGKAPLFYFAFPHGSFEKSCKIQSIEYGVGVVSARCNRKAGGELQNTRFIYAVCGGDIWNDDGRLRCNQDSNKYHDYLIKMAKLDTLDKLAHDKEEKQKKEANENTNSKLSFMAAASTMLGRDATSEELATWPDAFRASSAKRRDMISTNVPVEEAKAFVREMLSRPQAVALRDAAITNSYQNALGRPPAVVEQTTWSAKLNTGSVGYTDIVRQIIDLSKTDQAQAQAVIDHAYQVSLGRLPTPDEVNKITPLDKMYIRIILEQRRYLYSDKGVIELLATINRAFVAKNKPIDDTKIKAAVAKCGISLAVYQEMIATQSCL